MKLDGIIVDNFAGGGGASTGIEAALGRAIDIAINHDEAALRMHAANHPGTVHIRNNIYRIDPREVAAGRPVRLAWFSPDCKHFSKAKGGKPREKSIRDLAWVVVHWAQLVKPDLILLENVEEFRTWGPLDHDGYPIKERAGETFDQWCKALRKAGYKLQFRELRACDYGAPTIRKRFFMVARCDGQPIVWPAPTHGKPDSPGVIAGQLKPWRTAAQIIDWSIPCPSIFERKKPLAEKTLRRIAHGIMKFVVNNPKPFIVGAARFETGQTSGGSNLWEPSDLNSGSLSGFNGPTKKAKSSAAPNIQRPNPHTMSDTAPLTDARSNAGGASLPFVPTSDSAPFIAPLTHQGSDGRAYGLGDPLHTVTGANRGEMALISPHITKFRSGAVGHAIDEPMHTVTANSFVKRPGGAAPLGVVEAAVAPFSTYAQQGGANRSAEDPMHTVTASNKDQNCVAAAHLVHVGNGEREGQAPRAMDVAKPLGTVVAGGIKHHLAEAILSPVIVGCGGRRGQSAPVGPEQPYPTATAKADACVVAAFMQKFAENGQGVAPTDPLHTVMAGAPRHAVVAAHLAQMNKERTGVKPGRSVAEPVSTITTSGSHQQVVTSNLLKLRGTSEAHVAASAEPVDAPLNTVSAQGTHMAEVRAFLIKYYGNEQTGHGLSDPLGTVTVQDRFGLVTVTIDGEEYVIVDIGMRMLTPRELFNAQGFPPDYIIDHDADGVPMTKTAQVAKCGNSVCPPLAEALVRANMPDECAVREAESVAA